MTVKPEELLQKAEFHLDRGEYKAADDIIDRFFASVPEKERTAAQVIRSHLCAARALIYRTEHAEALKHCEEALRLAERDKDLGSQAKALRWLGNLNWRKGDSFKALDLFQEGLIRAKKAGDREMEGIFHIEMGNAFSEQGDRPRGMEEFRIAIRILEKLKGSSELARAYNNLGDSYMYYKNWDKAAEYFSKVKGAAGDHISRKAWGGFNKAECLMEMGKYKEAKEELKIALPLIERSGDNYGKCGAYQILGLVRAKSGDWDQGKADLEYAVDLATRNGMPISKGRVLKDLGRIHMWKGDKERAKRFFDEARKLFEEHGSEGDLRMLDMLVAEMKL